ncbi:hypothetical protein AALP_AA1G047100 [Arabis alpina]|uniref:Uncharacterized protein n=1 Tax=Arabis alpina TaxID=50452 RepID=A0A087HL48_ARAAL|nr:hypothetical protein AALP_AA1G047100 [Arabis alpina]
MNNAQQKFGFSRKIFQTRDRSLVQYCEVRKGALLRTNKHWLAVITEGNIYYPPLASLTLRASSNSSKIAKTRAEE